MAHPAQQEFCSRMRDAYPHLFVNKKVLDIGALDINGNNRFLFTNCNYIGLDVGEGNNVDIVAVGHQYDAPDEQFDVIVSTEVFEHDMFYEKTIQNAIRLLKDGGVFLFTCASTGRPEHGTRSSDGTWAAPLLQQISEEWADYYKNLTEADIRGIKGFDDAFPDGIFEYNSTSSDLYFFGVKGGIDYHQRYIQRTSGDIQSDWNYFDNQYSDDIFVVGAWPNTSEKEADLLECIARLRNFKGIPILLVSHYAIKAEIQKLVDYYIFDKNNELLTHEEFPKYNLADVRWTQMVDHRVENEMEFHHDYAIWVSMQHAFNFCKYLGKKQIHYMEYDNLIDVFQYKQAFLEKAKEHDAVLYEYHHNSIRDTHLAPFCATFIFSAKTDLLLKMVGEVNSKEEYFSNRPNGWQLERVFLHYLQKHTNNYIVSPYIANQNELNTQAVWNRDGILREGIAFQLYPCVDDADNFYMHLMSGFHENEEGDDVILEFRYGSFSRFEKLHRGEYKTILLGQYERGKTARVFLFGKEIFTQFLSDDSSKFRRMNKLSWTNQSTSNDNTINIHFVDGPYVEITGNKQTNYTVDFIDTSTDEVVYSTRLKNNTWARTSKKWYAEWLIRIKEENSEIPFTHKFDLRGRRVFIVFESSSLGDTLAWIPYVEEFRKQRECHVIVSTFHNNLFLDAYPHLEFVNPGTTVDKLHALYRLGCFYNNNEVDLDRHKTDFRKLRLQEYATDILGLEFREIRPRIKPITPIETEKPYVCIANHSTAQAKYWNNETGWQELVDYIKQIGYDVYLLSREEDGYMGNKNPSGVIKVDNKSLEEISSIMLGSKGFIGISSGLSWLAWSLGVPTVLISGTTDEELEPTDGISRVINKEVCYGCFGRHLFDKGDWSWCPDHKGTERQFECSKSITFVDVKPYVQQMLGE